MSCLSKFEECFVFLRLLATCEYILITEKSKERKGQTEKMIPRALKMQKYIHAKNMRGKKPQHIAV